MLNCSIDIGKMTINAKKIAKSLAQKLSPPPHLRRSQRIF